MREFDRAAALGENREQTSSDRGSTPLASIHARYFTGRVAFWRMRTLHAPPIRRAASMRAPRLHIAQSGQLCGKRTHTPQAKEALT